MNISYEQFLAPVKELNELTLKSIEKIAAVQVKAIQENAETSIESLKASAAITDLDSLNEYLQTQLGVAQSVSDKTVKDAQKIAKLAESYANSVQSIVEKSVPKV